MTDWSQTPHKRTFPVSIWEPGRSPQDGPPDRIEYDTHWFEADGTGITDKARIAELESQESHHGRSPHQ